MTFDSQHLITIPDILLAVAQDLSAFIDPYILSKHYRESWLFICLRFITKPPNDFMQKKKKKKNPLMSLSLVLPYKVNFKIQMQPTDNGFQHPPYWGFHTRKVGGC